MSKFTYVYLQFLRLIMTYLHDISLYFNQILDLAIIFFENFLYL